MMVMTRYTAYRIRAVERILGTSLSIEGPGISARIMCMARPSPLAAGKTASAKTRIPMPPIQWVKLRQNSIPRDRLSTSVRMLEPVVVKPDTVSKKLSTKLGISPLR